MTWEEPQESQLAESGEPACFGHTASLLGLARRPLTLTLTRTLALALTLTLTGSSTAIMMRLDLDQPQPQVCTFALGDSSALVLRYQPDGSYAVGDTSGVMYHDNGAPYPQHAQSGVPPLCLECPSPSPLAARRAQHAQRRPASPGRPR